jgi:hypothetical protein
LFIIQPPSASPEGESIYIPLIAFEEGYFISDSVLLIFIVYLTIKGLLPSGRLGGGIYSFQILHPASA